MIPKSGHRFSEKIMLNQTVSRARQFCATLAATKASIFEHLIFDQ
jgi:hypothetical protein